MKTGIKNQSQSRKLYSRCINYGVNPADIELADGQTNAVRVMVGRNRKTGELTYSVCCPWLLADIFSI